MSTKTVLAEIAVERKRQDSRFGQQNWRDGTWVSIRHRADRAREKCDIATKMGQLTWLLILDEEVAEAFAEEDPDKLRAELIQVAAVAAAWVEAIDRRSGK